MKVLLLTLILNIASVRFCNGEEEEEDRDELQQGFFEVDYMLQVNPTWSTRELRKLMKLMKSNQTKEAATFIDKEEVNLDHALFFAALLGRLQIVQTLLDKGAKVDVPENFQGDTALIAASEAGNIDVVKSLVRAGAKVDARDTYGLTALHKAARKNEIEVVKALLEAGADPNLQGQLGNTPLNSHKAKAPVVAILLAAGGNPNIGDYSSRTPLHNAAQFGNLEVTKALVAGGGLAGGKDKYGDTATNLARDFGHPAVHALLEEAEKKQS